MPSNQILGVVALVVGAVLLAFAYRASNAPVDQIAEALTGRVTDQTMLYGIGGLIAVVVGSLMVLRR